MGTKISHMENHMTIKIHSLGRYHFTHRVRPCESFFGSIENELELINDTILEFPKTHYFILNGSFYDPDQVRDWIYGYIIPS